LIIQEEVNSGELKPKDIIILQFLMRNKYDPLCTLALAHGSLKTWQIVEKISFILKSLNKILVRKLFFSSEKLEMVQILEDIKNCWQVDLQVYNLIVKFLKTKHYIWFERSYLDFLTDDLTISQFLVSLEQVIAAFKIEGKVLPTIPENTAFLSPSVENFTLTRKEYNGWAAISQSQAGSNLLVSNKSWDSASRRRIKGKILETLEIFGSEFQKNPPEVSPEILKSTMENISTIENFIVTEEDNLVYHTWEHYQKYNDVEKLIWNMKSLITHIHQRNQTAKLQIQMPPSILGNARTVFDTPDFFDRINREGLSWPLSMSYEERVAFPDSDEKISRLKFRTGTSESHSCFLDLMPTTINEGSCCQEDRNTVTFKDIINSAGHVKPSKPSQSTPQLPDSFEELEIHDFNNGCQQRRKIPNSIDVPNDFGQPAIQYECSVTSGSQRRSSSKRTIDVNEVSPVSQLRRSRSVLIQEPDHSGRQRDMFGNLGSTFTPETPKGKPQNSKTYFAEESAEELLSIPDNDKPTILNLIKGDFDISPDIESPGKATGLDSPKKETLPKSGNPHSPPNSKPEPEDTSQSRDAIISKHSK
jgi:hypothetical protein